MPPEHQKYVQWNGEQFIHWAGKVGSNTQVAVQAILNSYKVEQQGYPYKETKFFDFDRFLFTSWRDKSNRKGKNQIPWGVPVD